MSHWDDVPERIEDEIENDQRMWEERIEDEIEYDRRMWEERIKDEIENDRRMREEYDKEDYLEMLARLCRESEQSQDKAEMLLTRALKLEDDYISFIRTKSCEYTDKDRAILQFFLDRFCLIR